MHAVQRFAAPLLALGLLTAVVTPARAVWSHDPSQNNAVLRLGNGQTLTSSLADGAGGAFVLWQDARTDASDLYLQRLTSGGTIAPGWNATGAPVCTATGAQLGGPICADGAGGVYVAWTDLRSTQKKVYVQRLTASGAVAPGWPVGGLLVANDATHEETDPRMCADGAGGVYVTWTLIFNVTDFDVRVTRVNPNATIATGFPLTVDAGLQFQSSPQVVGDGAGGVIVGYEDNASGTYDIHVKRFASNGALAYNYLHGPFTADQKGPQLVPDGFGGVLVGYTDSNGGVQAVEVFRLNVAGGHLWSSLVLDANPDPRILQSMVSDGARGAYVLSSAPLFFNTLWTINRILPNGAIAPGWLGTTGTNIASGMLAWARIAPDGKGGLLTFAANSQSTLPTVNRWSANGTQAAGWTGAGTIVSYETPVGGAALVDDGNGGAIAFFSDARNGFDDDVYAMRVERFGVLGNPEPTIVSVKDVALDQGGQVRVSWTPSWLDADPTFGVSSYRVWRQLPAAAAQQALARGAADRVIATREAGPTSAEVTYWELVGTQLASAQAGYSDVVPTAGDSVGAGLRRTLCMVEAVGPYGSWWDSAPDSGYSVDNLPPAAPAPFTALWGGASTRLTWGPNHEADFLTYRLYRGTNAGFAIGTGSLFAEKPDTGYVAPTGNWYYKLTAVDVHGNESPVALVTPPGSVDVDASAPAALAFSLVSANPVRGAAELRLALPRATRVKVAVYDAAGRLVRTLADGAREAGEHAIAWDGLDEAGAPAQAGLYFARVVAGREARAVRMVRL